MKKPLKNWYDVMVMNVKVVPTVNQIIYAVGTHFEITRDEILSTRRFRTLVDARMICAAIMREECKMTWAAIGAALGNKHHTTVMFSVSSHHDYIEFNREYRYHHEAVVGLLRGAGL